MEREWQRKREIEEKEKRLQVMLKCSCGERFYTLEDRDKHFITINHKIAYEKMLLETIMAKRIITTDM